MPYTLLLADDSATIQRVIALTFAGEDVRVVAVSDGDQAIASLDRQPPDIVLADVGMPGRNGYDVASYVKSQPQLAHIPVLLLTGAFEPIDEGRAHRAGGDGVLAKPFEPKVVIKLVNDLLAGARGGAAPPVPSAVAKAGPASPTAAGAGRVTADAAAAPGSPADYFDELDAALAKLPGARADAASALDELRTGRRPVPAPPGGARALSATRETPPALAAALAALLAAEPDTASSAATAASPPAPAISDELVERVARRVLEKLSDRVVQEAVADLIATIAERVVRAEIERSKGPKW